MPKRSFSNYLLLVLLSVGIGVGCSPRNSGPSAIEPETTVRVDSLDRRGFDALDDPVDRLIAPAVLPVVAKPVDPFVSADSTVEVDTASATGPRQIWRIQIESSDRYSRMQRIERIAREIFDQPVRIDYETPNFKVRVGGFAARRDADAYRSRAIAAGFPNAIVVPVTVGLQKLAPRYGDTLSVDPLHETELGERE